MIICICNRINGKAVEQAVQGGASSPRSVLAYHGCAFNCGKCKCELRDHLVEALDKAGESVPLLAAE